MVLSFFDKVKASIGIGAVKVDTQLGKKVCRVGEEVNGVIRMEGGNVSQNIQAVKLYLMTEVKKESDDKEYYVDEPIQIFTVSNGIEIGKGERKDIPFSFILPPNTPVTFGRTKVWVRTELDIPMALDQQDKDYIRIEPSIAVSTAVQAVEILGFTLRKVDCEYQRGVVQEFEFYPTSGNYKGVLDELEMVFNVHSTGLNIRLQVDRRARNLGSLLSEMMNMDETNTGLYLSDTDISQGPHHVARKINEVISRYS